MTTMQMVLFTWSSATYTRTRVRPVTCMNIAHLCCSLPYLGLQGVPWFTPKIPLSCRWVWLTSLSCLRSTLLWYCYDLCPQNPICFFSGSWAKLKGHTFHNFSLIVSNFSCCRAIEYVRRYKLYNYPYMWFVTNILHTSLKLHNVAR
jgi:hypothetical protein